jgi:hypothetical protein
MPLLKLIAPLLAVGAVAHGPAAPAGHSLLQSRELWATVDICNPPDQANTVGIRGSMPGDGRPKDAMFMSFRVQYLDATTHKWVDLAQGANSGFVAVGSAKTTRQAGHSFQFAPKANALAFTLRGVVSYQWRRGKRVVHSASRPTTTGHQSLAGADPAEFSAASCSLP